MVFERDVPIGHALRTTYYSRHYFCPLCAEIWARVVGATPMNNDLMVKCCKECWDTRRHPWQTFDYVAPIFSEQEDREHNYGDPLHFSASVLKRDFLWLMEHQ